MDYQYKQNYTIGEIKMKSVQVLEDIPEIAYEGCLQKLIILLGTLKIDKSTNSLLYTLQK